VLGDLRADELTREMIGALIRRVRESGRSLAIVEGLRNPLRGYYRDLIETKQFAGPSPAADLKHFIGRRAQRKAHGRALACFTHEEGPQLFATARGGFPRWYAFLLTGVLAGLRWGASAALYRADIDWTRGRLHVARTFSEKANRVEAPKDGDGRWIAASPALLAALRAHADAVELEGQVKGWTPEQRQLMFPNTLGRITHHGQFSGTVWKPLLAKAWLPQRKYHATRHTYATWMLEGGADLRWVQQQMGHASIEETAGTYGHVSPARHHTASAALDRYLDV
jgi:integrase